MVIELASPNAVPHVVEVLRRCTQSMIEQGIYQWDDLYPNVQSVYDDAESRSLFVAWEGEVCVGSVCLNECEPDEYRLVPWQCDSSHVLVAHRLCVDPAWQGHGIAHQLMNFIERLARTEGYKCIHLDAYLGNPRALRLYERRGYQRVGTVSFPRRSLPFVCFELRIEAEGK